MIRLAISVLMAALLQQGSGQDDKILERGEKLLEEAKTAYEEARTKSSVAAFVDAGFKLEEARIKFIVLQEIGSPEKQKIATDRMRAINQLGKLIHDGKVAISGAPAETGVPAAPKPAETAPDKPAPPKPAVEATQRRPVPDPAKQRTAEKQVRDLFSEQYAKKSPADRKALARLLMDQAAGSPDDPVAQWVLHREAQAVAAQICDVPLTLEAIELSARLFDVDTLPMKTAALSLMAKTAKTPDELAALADALLTLVDELIREDQFDAAEKAATLAAQSARKGTEVVLTLRASARAKEVGEAKVLFQSMKSVMATQAKNPDDPAANLDIGRFLCFVKGSWDLGLRFVAKGSDPVLKALAEKEIAFPLQPVDRAALADAWYDLGDKEKSSLRKQQITAHARDIYTSALPDAPALLRAHITKRLSGMGQASPIGNVDLIKLLDPKRDAVLGVWTVQGGVLESPKDRQFNRIQILYSPGSEYDLYATVERKEESSDFVLGLASGERQFAVQIDAWESQVDYSGINLIDGKYGIANEGVFRGRLLTQDKRSMVVCAVRKTGVTVTVDGKKVIDWKGELDRLSLGSNMALPRKDSLFVGSWGARFRVTQLSVTPLSGEGRILR